MEPHRSPYHPLMKLKALKILIDYSKLSGRKWTSIRKEILNITGVSVSDKSPIFVRQDLENWAKGSVLSDDKFRWIYAFLTHPITLQRPEFYEARSLSDPNIEFLNDGRTLQKFTDNFTRLKTGLSIDFFDERNGAIFSVEQLKTDICGMYEFLCNQEGYFPIYLSISEVEEQEFLSAHLLISLNDQVPTSTNWNARIIRGYAIIGAMISFYFSDASRAENFYVYPVSLNNQKVIWHGTFKDTLFHSMIEFDVEFPAPLYSHFWKVLDGSDLRFSIKRTNSSELQKILDDYSWSTAV